MNATKIKNAILIILALITIFSMVFTFFIGSSSHKYSGGSFRCTYCSKVIYNDYRPIHCTNLYNNVYECSYCGNKNVIK